MKTGKEKLIEQFVADGIKYMFGNPGTVEQGFLDAMQSYKDIQYITCLHETVAVGMADGYARKSKSCALVQLHSGVGLGNGIGMLYQAYRGHAPLVVIAGEAGIRYDAMDAQMACDLVEMATPVTKWAGRVVHSGSLLRTVRKAVKIAMTPPMGPVFISLPMDILDEDNEETVMPSVVLETQTAPKKKVIKKAAKKLLNAKDPLFIIGDGIAYGDAKNEIEELAALVAAKVYGADDSEVNFNTTLPNYKGQLGHMFGENSRKKVENADVVLIVGTYVFPEVFPCIDTVFDKKAKIIHIDLNTYEIAKNHNVTTGIAAHPKTTLKKLNKKIKEKMDSEQEAEILKRKEKLEKEAENNSTPKETFTDKFMKLLRETAGEDVIIFDEALTSSGSLSRYFPPKKEGTFFQTRGGSLGVGIPGAMGIKLSENSDRPVLAFTGDGGSMYTIQALHTAARYNINVKIIICNNKTYQLLADNIDHYWNEEGIQSHTYPDCFSLEPVIDFVALAKSMGIADGMKVESESDIKDGVTRMMSSKTAFILDLQIQ